MNRHSLSALVVLISAWAAALGSAAAAAERVAAELFPPTTVVYAEISHPGEVLQTVLDHPLRERIEALEDYRKALERPEYLQFKAVVSVVEAQLGLPWRQAVEMLTSGGIYAGVDARSEGVALLIKSQDAQTPKKVVDTFLKLTREDAKRNGNDDPVRTAEYRGVPAYELNKARFAAYENWLLLTNKPELGKEILDAMLDGRESALAGDAQFQAARQSDSGGPAGVWVYVNLAALRDAGAAKNLFRGRSENPAVELLVGGLLATLQKTPYATLALQLDKQHAGFTATMPHDQAWVGEVREFYFGPDGRGTAPPLLTGERTLFTLSTYRDVSGMWLRAGDLFDQRVNDQLAQAESNLSTLFSGKDFGEEILGAVQPEIQLIAARQDFGDATPQPAIQIPAFAAVFRLRDPAKMQGELRRTFQSLVGFLNVVGAMQGQPQLDQDIEREGDAQILTATYAPGEDDRDSREAKINFNFSPSVAFVNDRFVVASTKALARQLATAKQVEGSPEAGTTPNSRARFQLGTLRDVLQDNRRHLVAQNMLEQGNDKATAEKQIDALLAIIGVFRDASLELATGADRVRLDVQVNLVADE